MHLVVKDMQADCKPAQRCDSTDIEEYLDFVLQQYPQEFHKHLMIVFDFSCSCHL